MIALRRMSWLLVFAAGAAHAQTLPSTFTTNPSPPHADQPFDATFSTTTNAATVGFWGTPQVQISANVITIPFDYGCGFLCPGADPAFKAFPFAMPALPEGNYVVRFIDDFSNPIAQFDLAVVAANASVASTPALSPLLLMMLALTFIGTGSADAKRRRVMR